MRIGYQGEPGAYSEAALVAWFGEDAVAQPCTTFVDVAEGLATGVLNAAVLPVENSYAGDVGEVYDLFWRYPLLIHGEITLPVQHCLLGLPGSDLKDIRRVWSHPQGLAQCREFLRSHGITAEPVHDTAAAARLVVEEGDREVGAIASARAAAHYGLDILEANIQDHQDNTTRFYIFTTPDVKSVPGPATARRRTDQEGRPQGKTCLLFAVQNKPGALYRCLGIFASHHINMTKLTSRPYPDQPWNYMFIADIAGTVSEPAVAQALAELEEQTVLLKVLGSFPAYAAL